MGFLVWSRHLVICVFVIFQTCSCELGHLLRRHRSLVYPDPRGSETKVQVLFGLGLPMEGEISMTLGYVIKCNYNLPYNSSTISPIQTRERRNPSGSRWSIYKILELGFGRSCLLRAICEAADSPFNDNALTGQVLQAILTPSRTDEEYEIYEDREYHAAESHGRKHECWIFQRDCPQSPLDYFTRLIDF